MVDRSLSCRYALGGETLALYTSKAACERYRVPNRVIFTNPDTTRYVDKIKAVGPMEEDGFKVTVTSRDGHEETLTFRFRDRPTEAAAWQDVLSRCVDIWKPRSVGDRDAKSPQELQQVRRQRTVFLKTFSVDLSMDLSMDGRF